MLPLLLIIIYNYILISQIVDFFLLNIDQLDECRQQMDGLAIGKCSANQYLFSGFLHLMHTLDWVLLKVGEHYSDVLFLKYTTSMLSTHSLPVS